MSKSFEKYQKRRLAASYFSVVISITLVLLLLGFLGLTVLKYQKMSSYFKEKVTVTLYLKDRIKEKELIDLKKFIAKQEFTNHLSFISKKKAAEDFSKEIGEDFLTFLGDNPLKSYYEITLKADYVSPATLVYIKKDLEKNAFIEEVAYDAPLVDLLTRNIKTIGFWLIILSAVLAIIATLLLNSSIRLSIYAKRFTIKTMQMVGATRSFIRRPFIWASMKLGIIGAALAIIIFIIICFRVDEYLPALELLKDAKVLAIVIGSVLFLGVFITMISSFFATQKFLKLKMDKLYI